MTRRSAARPKSPRIRAYPDEVVVLGAIADHMGRILDALHDYGHKSPKWQVRPDAPMIWEQELLSKQFGPGGDWTSDSPGYAASAGLLFLVAQADHLSVLHEIYDSYVGLTFGVSPPARSLLEINGYVYWLLHPDIDHVRTRAARVLLSQIHDARRELTAAKDMGAPMPMISPRGRDLKALKRRAETEYYPSERSRDRRGHLILRGQGHPGPGAALKHLSVVGGQDWNSKGAYSYLSNAAHPTLHVIADTIMQDPEAGVERFGHADAVFHYRLGRLAMVGLLSTWELVAAYRGCDTDLPRALRDQINELPEPKP